MVFVASNIIGISIVVMEAIDYKRVTLGVRETMRLRITLTTAILMNVRIERFEEALALKRNCTLACGETV